jgi:type I restriction enzyme, S subunit
MELRKGYKQTDVGVIPEDWELKSISSITEIIGGGTPSTIVPEYWNGQIPWVSAGDISNANGRYVCETAYRITVPGLASCPARIVPEGTTIIIARGATVGRMAQLGMAMTFNQTCYGLLPTKFLDQDYLYYSMLFSVGSINAFTYGTIFGTITTNSFQEWKLPLPPLSEQQAIAAALSDVDTLLNALEALIAKKRFLKQGAMQELLTGRKRVPKFSDEWQFKALKDIAPLQRGFDLPNTQLKAGNYPVVYSNGILNFHSSFRVKAPGVVTGRSGTIGKVNYLDTDFWPHNTTLWVTDFKGNSPKFIFYLYYFLKFERFGTGSGVPTLNRNDVHDYEVLVPPTTEEQAAIAEILSDMDAEIAALEQKCEKTRLLKQGMMQELLTGRIRLV